MHPLYGRRFAVLSISHPLNGAGHVVVAYRQSMTLRIPHNATTLALSRPSSATKLTAGAVADLVALAEDCEALCPLLRATSGAAGPQRSNNRSATTSRRSSRR
jgi:hypothetical protein